MSCLAAHIARRAGYHVRIDRWFDALPPELAEAASPLRMSLGRPEARTGLSSWFFLGGDPPVLDYVPWALDDLGVACGAARLALEEELYRMTYWHFAALQVGEMVLSPGSVMAREHALLAQLFRHAGDACLSAVAAPGSAAWELAREALSHHTRAALIYRRGPRPGAEGEARRSAAAWLWAPALVAVRAAMEHAGAGERAAGAVAIAAELSGLHQVHGELFRVASDAERGVLSYPAERAAAAIGMRDVHIGRAADLAGALLSSGTGAAIAGEEHARAIACAERAEGLGLARFAAAARRLACRYEEAAQLLELGALFATAGAAAPAAEPTAVEGRALAMAEAALTADPTLREAWEIHRWGLLGEPVLTASLFASGLIQENLAATGKDISAWAEGALRRFAEQRFQYFQELSSLPPDIDAVGMMLRLARAPGVPHAAAAALEEPLGWALDAMEEDGGVPTWLSAGIGKTPGYAALQGGKCTACMVHLIRGLCRFDAERLSASIRRAVSHVVRRTRESGGAGAVFYSSLYLAWQLGELAAELDGSLAEEREAVFAVGRALLSRHLGPREVTPQDAALLILACAAHARNGSPIGVERRWTEAILIGQRWDGEWEGEPIYQVPAPGNAVRFHASRLITTSLCHRALWTLQNDEDVLP